MSEELKEHNPMRIVAAMKKSACFLLFLLVAAPAFAQTGQQFGILFGGVKRLYSSRDRLDASDNTAGVNETLPIDRFRLTSGAREVFYAVQIEPATLFKIQAGQWNTDVGIVQSGKDHKTQLPIGNGETHLPRKGTVQHVDGIIDYRFSEPFGTTGLFAGLGLYRWSASGTSDAVHDVPTETNYGYVFGVNGEFPITKRYAFMVEGAYHWINMSSPVRYVTVMGGVRVGF
jgi:hypothetical protein